MSDDFPELGGTEKVVEADDKRQVSTLGLLMIAFFWVCGGIYGNEELVYAAPSGYVFIFLLSASLCYALPMSLISAELATALPYDGGLVAWVEETCGKTVGLHNMYWLWISYLFDAAAYPLLAASYIAKEFDLSKITGSESTGQLIVAEIIIALVTLVKLGGTDYIVKASVLFFVLSIAPTIVFTVYGSKEMKPKTWMDTNVDEPPGFEQALLISWVTWLFCGFNSLGALAGEIKDPKKTYPIVIGILIPMATITIVWPVAVSLSIDNNRTHYQVGYFNTLAEDLLGAWIGWAMTIGAVFSFIGLYNAQIMVCERSLAAFAEDSVSEYLNRRKRSVITRYLLQENGTGVAPFYIIFNGGISGALLLLPVQTLVELAMLQMCLNLMLFLYAFIWYKWHRPNMERPLRMPGGVFGAVVLSFPVAVVTGATFYFAAIDPTPVFGFPYGKSCGLGVIVVAGVFIHLFAIMCQKCFCNGQGYEIDDDDDYHLKTPLVTNSQ